MSTKWNAYSFLWHTSESVLPEGPKMFRIKALCTVVAMSLAYGGTALAQGRDWHDGRGRDGPPMQRYGGDGRYDGPNRVVVPPPLPREYDQRGPAPVYREYRQFHRGERLPQYYRHRHYIVNDWRGHHLRPPPRGYQWVQVGTDYLLVALATGLIADILVGR
jgi:Ni/Co efflux regulator RcnB